MNLEQQEAAARYTRRLEEENARLRAINLAMDQEKTPMGYARIVYGENCVWWDSIDKASTKGPGGLPCCPHCGSVLFEIEAGKWWKGVRDLAEKKPGYDELIAWMRGKCFPTYPEAMAAYEEEKGVDKETENEC